MKYIILSFLLFGVFSCTNSTPENGNTQTSTSSDINVWWVQISNSGVSVSSDTGNISIGANGNVIMTHESWSMSMGDGGMIMTNGDQTMTMSGGMVSVGTGMKISVGRNSDVDPEVENITKDIDTIFEDAGQEAR